MSPRETTVGTPCLALDKSTLLEAMRHGPVSSSYALVARTPLTDVARSWLDRPRQWFSYREGRSYPGPDGTFGLTFGRVDDPADPGIEFVWLMARKNLRSLESVKAQIRSLCKAPIRDLIVQSATFTVARDQDEMSRQINRKFGIVPKNTPKRHLQPTLAEVNAVLRAEWPSLEHYYRTFFTQFGAATGSDCRRVGRIFHCDVLVKMLITSKGEEQLSVENLIFERTKTGSWSVRRDPE